MSRIAQIAVAGGEQVAPAAAVPRGPVLLTLYSGPGCAPPVGRGVSFGPCAPLPNSCTGRVTRVDPSSGVMSTLLTIDPSTLVTDALPSPDRRMVVMISAGCDTSFADFHLEVRDLRSGHQWSLGADAPRCHVIGVPSWSADGSKLVFPYGPSLLRNGTKPSTAQQCSGWRLSRLVVIAADRSSRSRSWKQIPADKHCSFVAAAFDRRGIAAVEACQHGPHRFTPNTNQGYAFLLQLGHGNRVLTRIRLQPGWEDGLVSTEFRDGTVLISQDQPANAGYPERDWIWQFDGHHLRTIVHYRAEDAAQVLATPW